MRRLGGVVLFLALFSACEPADGDATVAVVTATTAEATATTSTSTSSSTSTSTSSTTTTTVARPSTTAATQRVTASTVPAVQRVPTITTVQVAEGGACDPNYAGACVPIDSDVDCAGGTGNGPSFTSAKDIQVIGSDIYGLDGNDNDGIGCETSNR